MIQKQTTHYEFIITKCVSLFLFGGILTLSYLRLRVNVNYQKFMVQLDAWVNVYRFSVLIFVC